MSKFEISTELFGGGGGIINWFLLDSKSLGWFWPIETRTTNQLSSQKSLANWEFHSLRRKSTFNFIEHGHWSENTRLFSLCLSQDWWKRYREIAWWRHRERVVTKDFFYLVPQLGGSIAENQGGDKRTQLTDRYIAELTFHRELDRPLLNIWYELQSIGGWCPSSQSFFVFPSLTNT
jgi:hypothetical protein